jgi:hypothetical protein
VLLGVDWLKNGIKRETGDARQKQEKTKRGQEKVDCGSRIKVASLMVLLEDLPDLVIDNAFSFLEGTQEIVRNLKKLIFL